MSFTTDWGVTLPADHSKFKDIPGGVRNLRVDLADRLAAILSGFTTGETIAGIKLGRIITQGTGNASTPPGTGSAASIDIFGKTIGSNIEILAIDNNGSVGTFILAKAGDWLTSSVATAHPGWTNVSSTYTGKFMRIGTSPLTTGGADTHSHTLAVANLPVNSVNIETFSGGVSDLNHVAAGTSLSVGNSPLNVGGSGSAFTGDNVPVYVQVTIFQKD